jgi:GTP-binding protein Era
MNHKAGFVNIIGSPNVGKSTLMNALVGERISIITSKAQTTRDRILGIVNGEDFQIIYSDTPGVIHPGYKLHEAMMKSVETAFKDADIMLFMTDINEEKAKVESILSKIQKIDQPVLLLVNKIDLADQKTVENRIDFWKSQVPNAEILALSALEGFNVDAVLNRIIELLPESPPYFPKDQLTDKPERFFVAEMIREQIFEIYQKEVPYSSAVIVESFKEEENIIRIRSEIIVERDSQKGIIIGHQGKSLKKVGTNARKQMERFLQKKVFLELYVRVNKDWRKDQNSLKRLGYGQ